MFADVPVQGVCVMLPAIRDVGAGFRRRLYADSLALQVRLTAAPGVSTVHIATVGSTQPSRGSPVAMRSAGSASDLRSPVLATMYKTIAVTVLQEE